MPNITGMAKVCPSRAAAPVLVAVSSALEVAVEEVFYAIMDC